MVLGMMPAAQFGYGAPSPRDDQIVGPGGGVKETASVQSIDTIIEPRLLLWPQVQKELSLSNEQKQAVKELSGPSCTRLEKWG